ncbi:MAG: slipin family protein [Nitrososphaerota archaeon]|nr:slipin family protein [Nitrososphaerales archaeon]MDW8045090.1 slipin family protein [Nitrososphaerota archaeon]
MFESFTSLGLQLGTILPLAILIIIILSIILPMSIKIVKEYERIVVFRMGRLMGAKGPGLQFVIPFIDRVKFVDLRLITMDVPKQRIITRDNVSVDVDAVVYFRVADPISAVVKVMDYIAAASLLSQTTLRDVIGQVEFDDLLSKRDELNKRIQTILDEVTEAWGVKVTAVALKDAVLPEEMQRAIAKQAEAEREKRSRIIMAEGERLAAEKMAEAAVFYAQNPSAMRLRELQTWTEISREKNLIVVTEGGGTSLGTLLGIVREIAQQKTK